MFLSGFAEREECASFVDLGFYTKKLSHVFYRCYSLKNLKIRCSKVAAFSSHQRCWWSKPSRVVLELQIGEFVCVCVGVCVCVCVCVFVCVFLIISVGACIAKAKERSSLWTRSYHMVVVVSFLLEVAIGY